MGTVDATMTPLKIPPKFVPYLEKYRIYDIFYDMCIFLIRFKPDDVLSFLKQELTEYGRIQQKARRIIFIAPIHIDMPTFADHLAKYTEACIIKLETIVSLFNLKKYEDDDDYNAEKLASATSSYIENTVGKRSWILLGFPKTKEHARALNRKGVLPTHTIEILHTPEDYAVDDLWNKNLQDWTYEEYRNMLIQYKKNAKELREVYKLTHKKVIVRGRRMEQIVNECKFLLNKFPYNGMAFLPRIVIIGPRGSRRSTYASMLSIRFKLVHVNYDELLRRGATLETKEGEEIRHSELASINVDICIKLLEDHLLDEDCLKNGWVLTGFPKDDTDFKALDSIQTPPNRVIILDIKLSECMKRLQDRAINIYNGEVMSCKNTSHDRNLAKELATHPADNLVNVEIEHEAYQTELQGLLEYCEHKASIIDASGPFDEVFERIESAVIYPPQRFGTLSRDESKMNVNNSLFNSRSTKSTAATIDSSIT